MVIVCRMTLARAGALPCRPDELSLRSECAFSAGVTASAGVIALRQTQEWHASRVRKGQLLLRHIVETLPYFTLRTAVTDTVTLPRTARLYLLSGRAEGTQHMLHVHAHVVMMRRRWGQIPGRGRPVSGMCASHANAALPSPTRGALSGDRPQRSLARVQPGSYSCAQVLLSHMPVDIQQIRQQLQQI